MIIHRIKLENFGVYGGRHEVDLAPRSDGAFSRPIILMQGKNGVGKTSLVEAIRLVLHGSLALGSRVSQRAYREHLLKRIHRPVDAAVKRPDSAAITLEFDFVRGGEARTYVAKRSWHRTDSGVQENLTLLEDGAEPRDLHEEQIGHFLREMIPASAGELFFFDGERIEQLTADGAAQDILADSVMRLLGLHLVEQLDADLDVFIARQDAEVDDQDTSRELEAVLRERDALAENVAVVDQQRSQNADEIASLIDRIDRYEQKLASEGGAYAKRYDALKRDRNRLRVEVEAQKTILQNACNELLPFAVAPRLCRSVVDRLEIEARYERWKASQKLLEQQHRTLQRSITSDAFWEEVGLVPTEDQRILLADVVNRTLTDSISAEVVPEDQVFLHASEKDRGVLAGWIEQALGPVAEAFNHAADRLGLLQSELANVEAKLALAPADIILQPVVDALREASAELEERRAQAVQLEKELVTAQFKVEQAENRLVRLKEELERKQQSKGRVGLAIRTQRAFRAYAEVLRREKLAVLEEVLTDRFNALCRKETFVDHVHIDPHTFVITLGRGAETFGRDELSAGEKQLFAIATVWALREVSGIPLPIIVDTPLGRLDSDHRLSMLQTFFPQASHQVILLATDTEVDQSALAELTPAISHGFQMTFNSRTGRTELGTLNLESLAEASARNGRLTEWTVEVSA